MNRSNNLMRDPATASSRIYVGALSDQATEAQLQELFSKYGPIRGIMVSKGYGFVQFENDESAQNAIQNENQKLFLNRKIIVRTVQKSAERQSGSGGIGGGSGSGSIGGGSGGIGGGSGGIGGGTGSGGPGGNGSIGGSGGGPGSRDNAGRNNNNNNPDGGNFGHGGGNNSGGGIGPLQQQHQQQHQQQQQQQQQSGGNPSGGFGLPVFGGGIGGPDRLARWNHSSNAMRNQNAENSNDNGRERSPMNENRGGGPPPFGRPFGQNASDRFRLGGPRDQQSPGGPPQRPLPPMQMHDQPLEANDCEIVVTSKHLTQYAEAVENNLKQMGLTVDLLFPNSDVPIGKVLHNIASRGCLYAIIITQENLERRSITVNILYGQPEEHRNMPTDEALDFIEKDFILLRRGRDNCDTNVPFHALKTQTVPSQGFKHPDSVQYLLKLLFENRSLTVLQYDCVIKYLQEQRKAQYRIELGGPSGDFVPPTGEFSSNPDSFRGSSNLPLAGGSSGNFEQNKRNAEADTEAELQNKILNILNKPPLTFNLCDVGPSQPNRFDDKFKQYVDKNDFNNGLPPSHNRNDSQPPILNDPKVQKALDSLFQSKQFFK